MLLLLLPTGNNCPGKTNFVSQPAVLIHGSWCALEVRAISPHTHTHWQRQTRPGPVAVTRTHPQWFNLLIRNANTSRWPVEEMKFVHPPRDVPHRFGCVATNGIFINPPVEWPFSFGRRGKFVIFPGGWFERLPVVVARLLKGQCAALYKFELCRCAQWWVLWGRIALNLGGGEMIKTRKVTRVLLA